MTTLDRSELQAELQRLNDEAALKVRDPQFRDEQAAIIVEDIYETFLSENLVDILTKVRRGGLTETFTFRSLRGLKALHVSRGGYIEESKLTSDVDTIRRDQIGFHVVEHLDRLATGFYASAEELIRLGSQRLDAEINRRVFKTFEKAVPDPSADNYFGAVGGLSLPVLDEAIAYVEDQPVTSRGVLGSPVIVARAGMINKLKSLLTQNGAYAAFTPVTNEELLRRGVIAEYQGVPIVKLKNYLDENDKPYFPNNELWVVGEDAAQTVFYGTPWQTNEVEQFTQYWHFITRLDYGVAVVHPERLARIVDSQVHP